MPPIDLARILGGYTLLDVLNAFTLDHPDARYASETEVEIKGQVISIEGRFLYRGVPIGDFYRQLSYQKGSGIAEHQTMEVAPAHRERDVAKHHYTRAIRFYNRTPIRRVHLIAGGDGPWIWPQLGFDLVSRTHKEKLRKIALHKGFSGLPPAGEAMSIYAADIASTKRGGEAIGVACLKELAMPPLQGGFGRPRLLELEMFLDLDERVHREYLIGRGILGEVKEQP